jgi:hypothetical protein
MDYTTPRPGAGTGTLRLAGNAYMGAYVPSERVDLTDDVLLVAFVRASGKLFGAQAIPLVISEPDQSSKQEGVTKVILFQ